MSDKTGEETIIRIPAGQGPTYLLVGTELLTFTASGSQTGGGSSRFEAHHSIQRLCDAGGEPLHSAGETLIVGRLDQQVDVVPVHRGVHEPHTEALLRGCSTTAGHIS